MSQDLRNALWRKATASNASDNCVEVARAGDLVGVRDSKDRQGPHLEFNAAEWHAFTDGVRGGAF